MSSNLYWKPEVPEGKVLWSLKLVMRERHGLFGAGRNGVVLDHTELPFLEGIIAGGGDMAEDAKALAGAIREYRQVRIWEES